MATSAKTRKPPRGTGEHGNGAATLQVTQLRASGLGLVRHLDDRGKVYAETVVPEDEIPEAWTAQRPRPTRRCGACHSDRWRLDALGIDWICGRCHP